MAFAYQKTVDDMAIIWGAREQMARKFDFGAWTEMRIGCFWSTTTLGDNNTEPTVTETVPITTAYDRFFFGLKDESAVTPSLAGSRFVGMTNRENVALNSILTASAGNVTIGDAGQNFGVRGFEGATQATVSSLSGNIGGMSNADPAAATGYASFMGLRFVISNLGASSQTIAVSSSFSNNVAGTDYSAANLRTYLSAFAAPSSAITIDWNNGVTAYAIPDCWFLRNPFFNNRIRVHCMNAIKVAPV